MLSYQASSTPSQDPCIFESAAAEDPIALQHTGKLRCAHSVPSVLWRPATVCCLHNAENVCKALCPVGLSLGRHAHMKLEFIQVRVQQSCSPAFCTLLGACNDWMEIMLSNDHLHPGVAAFYPKSASYMQRRHTPEIKC